jgi:hypothetical protein
MAPRKDENESVAEDAVASGPLTRDEETGTYRTDFDGRTQPVSEAVVYAVAELTQTDPLNLPPLYTVLDPDALNHLFSVATGTRPQTETSVSFEYAGNLVQVMERGTIAITPLAHGRH